LKSARIGEIASERNWQRQLVFQKVCGGPCLRAARFLRSYEDGEASDICRTDYGGG